MSAYVGALGAGYLNFNEFDHLFGTPKKNNISEFSQTSYYNLIKTIIKNSTSPAPTLSEERIKIPLLFQDYRSGSFSSTEIHCFKGVLFSIQSAESKVLAPILQFWSNLFSARIRAYFDSNRIKSLYKPFDSDEILLIYQNLFKELKKLPNQNVKLTEIMKECCENALNQFLNDDLFIKGKSNNGWDKSDYIDYVKNRVKIFWFYNSRNTNLGQEKVKFISKGQLQPGNILLLMDEPTNTAWIHKIIYFGQSLVPNKLGNASLIHALIWCRNKKHLNLPEIAEAREIGGVSTNNLRKGLYFVYSSSNSNLSDCAAQIALTWANGNIKYNKLACSNSIIHSANFGKNAQLRAKLYSKDAFSKNPEWGVNGAYCSQFVVACYQAAASQIGIPYTGMISVDALHCSVRNLHSKLISDPNFSLMGALRIE